MKRALKMITSIMVSLVILAGCGSDKPMKTLVIKDTMDGIVKNISFEDELISLTEKNVSEYYDIDSKVVAEYEIRVSATGATTEELAIFKLTADSTASDTVKAMLEERKASLKKAFEQYIPAEIARLDKAIIVEKDGYILFSVSEDGTGVQKQFEAAFA